MHARRARTGITLTVLGAVLLAVTGCGRSDEPTRPIHRPTVRLYGTDGNASNSFGDAFKNRPQALWGMKATTALTPLSTDFKNRLRLIDPSLADFNYSGESYDAVAIAALASEYARSIEPETIAKYLVSVTTGGAICDSIAYCMELARDGKDFQYRGVSMRRSGLTDAGEPSSATYGIINFGRDNHVDNSLTQFVGAGDEKSESRKRPPGRAPDRPRPTTALKIGGLLPHTGRLAFAGPPLFAGARLAVKDANKAGGSVLWYDGDDGSTNPDIAIRTVDRHIGQGVNVIIGAASSGVTKAVLPKVVAAGRVLISPTATSDELTGVNDGGLFFRTAPPDVLQAKALADIIMRDGPRRISILTIDDNYGNGLCGNVRSNLVMAGIAPADIEMLKYPSKDEYDPKKDLEQIFRPLAGEVKSFGPDAVLVNGFDESAYAIQALLDKKVPLGP